LYPPLGEIRQVLRGHDEVIVVMQNHESPDGRTGAGEQIHTGQRPVRPSPQ